jgi:hypothetical protein
MRRGVTPRMASRMVARRDNHHRGDLVSLIPRGFRKDPPGETVLSAANGGVNAWQFYLPIAILTPRRGLLLFYRNP